MYILITYDINTSSDNGQKRLRQVSKCCQDFGQRVQNSVFECLVNNSDYIRLKSKLLSIIDPQTDSIRIYRLGKNYEAKIEHFGIKTSYNVEGELLI
ncbi:MAG: CRISPR-associated endonuclease Cas2 [Muribaculaceae bacterium]|nr:CRISPR-associated endonuclease Cas2 [Muribaculaceae bacterium]